MSRISFVPVLPIAEAPTAAPTKRRSGPGFTACLRASSNAEGWFIILDSRLKKDSYTEMRQGSINLWVIRLAQFAVLLNFDEISIYISKVFWIWYLSQADCSKGRGLIARCILKRPTWVNAKVITTNCNAALESWKYARWRVSAYFNTQIYFWSAANTCIQAVGRPIWLGYLFHLWSGCRCCLSLRANTSSISIILHKMNKQQKNETWWLFFWTREYSETRL